MNHSAALGYCPFSRAAPDFWLNVNAAGGFFGPSLVPIDTPFAFPGQHETHLTNICHGSNRVQPAANWLEFRRVKF